MKEKPSMRDRLKPVYIKTGRRAKIAKTIADNPNDPTILVDLCRKGRVIGVELLGKGPAGKWRRIIARSIEGTKP